MLCVLLFVFLLISYLFSQMIISCVFVFVMCSFFVFWIWAPLGMAPEIEERASVPCHGERIPLRIPKRISWTSRAALGPFTPGA